MDELDLRIRNHVYSSFVRDGSAASIAEVAGALQVPEGDVAAAYRRLHDAHALVLQPDETEIRMLNPFSAVETTYRVEACGRSWFANCAWDALGIPGALHADWRPRSPEESQAILDELGLTDAFWQLVPVERDGADDKPDAGRLDR